MCQDCYIERASHMHHMMERSMKRSCMQVYYFGLPDGWEPPQVGNDAALGLLLRLVHDGVEADG